MMILNTGDDALLARLHMIRLASRSIAIQTFIWKDDETGRLLLFELMQAARRGVRVQIIVDAMFGLKNVEMVASLVRSYPNFEIKYYNPTSKRIDPNYLQKIAGGIINFRKINQRMHNKVMIFDDRAAIVGGRNIENSYFDRAENLNFRDRDLLLAGSETSRIRESFDLFWNAKISVDSFNIKEIKKELNRTSYPAYNLISDYSIGTLFTSIMPAASNPSVVQTSLTDKMIRLKDLEFSADLPGKNESQGLSGGGHLTSKFLSTLQSAKKSVIIQTPYLILSKKAKSVFKSLANRKIPVYISTNSLAATDNWVAYSAAFKGRRWNIESGKLNIYEFKPFPLDLKTIMPRYDKTLEYYRANPGSSEPLLQHVFASRSDRANQLKLATDPFLCIHAKSLVIDEKLAVIGSYNLDPRSGNLNTEVALFTTTPEIVNQLKNDIANDAMPKNSWTIWRKKMAIPERILDQTFGRFMEAWPIDLWVLTSSTSFDIDGRKPIHYPGTTGFYENYTDRGLFPMLSPLHHKEIMTKLMKVVVKPLSPIL